MLRPYQERAIERFIEEGERAILVLPTGSGKTIIAIEIIKRRGYSALIVVPTIELLKQWKEKLKDYGIDAKLFYSEEKEIGKVTITTYKSVIKKEMRELIDNVDIIVLDEAHNIVGNKALIKLIKNKRVLGLTATPTSYLEEIAPVIRITTTDELIGKGYLADFEYRIIRIKPDSVVIKTLKKKRLSNFDFVKLTIRKDVLEAISRILSEAKGKTMIFTRTKAEATILGYLLKIPPITSDVPKGIRTKIINAFKSGILNKLITAKVLEEGIDIGDVENIIIVSGIGSLKEFVQRIGRALRPKPKAKIWEITYMRKKKLIEKRFKEEF